MEHAELEIAKQHHTAWLECFSQNHHAIGFYLHLGWKTKQKYIDPKSGAEKTKMNKEVG